MNTTTKSKCDRTSTPMTDKLYSDHIQDPLESIGDLAAIMHNQCERFERDLTAVTEQRDRLLEQQEQWRLSSVCRELVKQRDRLAEAIRLTLMENLDLCDGDICTLKRLKDAVGFDLDSLENANVDAQIPASRDSESITD